MSRKTNKLISKEGKKDYSEEAAEETIEMSQGGDEFDGADKEFEEARAEDIAFYRAHAEESTTRACSQRVMNMARYVTGTLVTHGHVLVPGETVLQFEMGFFVRNYYISV